MSIRRTHLLRVAPALVLTLIPALLSAHPGHEGGHDLTWEFAGQPLGGLGLAGGLLAVGIAGAWWLSRFKARQQPPAA